MMETSIQQTETEKGAVQDPFAAYIKSRDVKIRNEIVSRYLYLPEIIAKKFLGRGVDYDDLYQVASLALIKAVERFNPEVGVKFASFATPTILGEIKRFFRDKSTTMRIPRRIYEVYKKINQATEQLTQKYKRTPTVDEIADYLEISPDLVLESLETGNTQNIMSLDQTVNEDGNFEFHETIGQIDASLDRIADRDFVEKSMREFSEAEQEFIRMRYYSNKSQKAIADKMGVSQMYISRMEKKVLQKLRRILQY